MLAQQLRLAEAARDAANEQLVAALEAAARSGELERQVAEVQSRLDAALEALGERAEAMEALEEDIRDMKAIFHEQLGVAADQLAAARALVAELEAVSSES